MKKVIISCMLTLGIVSMVAQPTEFDAIKMTSTDIVGTARYVGMAGAFGALGGDASAIKDNPAGLAIYRKSEITATFNLLTQQSNSNWLGNKANDDLFKPGFDNFSYIISFPTWAALDGSTSGLLQSNWEFSFNRLKNFNRRYAAQNQNMNTSVSDYIVNFSQSLAEEHIANEYAYDDSGIPWISILGYDTKVMHLKNNQWATDLGEGGKPNTNYSMYEKGHVDEYSLSWGGNFSNIFYVGAAFNFQSINYSKTSELEEKFANNDYLRLKNIVATTGGGFNLSLGMIVRPADFVRIGASYRTPTAFSLTDYNIDYMNSGLDLGATFKTYQANTPEGDFKYKLRTPSQLTGSLGFIIGQRGIISTDVVYTNYKSMQFMDNGNSAAYNNENNGIDNMLKGNMLIKVGGEFRLDDHFSLRAGVAASTLYVDANNAHKLIRNNAIRSDLEYTRNKSTNYFTAGFGYRESIWYVDVALMNKNVTDYFYPYNMNGVEPATITTHNFDLFATVGFRF